ncbi:hypothetical protein M422DRAFT_783976 [Sphaerobolus stellatus SS14]|uniref:Transcription initiation factor IIE subunit beta n=1 Tax=Sphaerobolus stellatus (strain SS14) TaxID=990650 RepID=A0A0C9U7X2_SPHS4|nr:hypothetical protein M422DRAFT_783976 [Sphaerobolus stellatus SS14]
MATRDNPLNKSWITSSTPATIIPVSSSAGTTDEPPAKRAKKSKPKPDVVYSQPANTGSGQNTLTQLVYAINYLKSNQNPMRLQELAILTDTPLMTDAALLDRFKTHDRVVHDPKTDLYSYRHDYAFKNKASLLTEIQRHTRHGGGLSVRSLKETWKEAPQAIEELEKEGDVLVTRTVKDGQMRFVFWNEVRPDEDKGGIPVEKEFQDLWHSLTVPADADLLKALASEGLQATAAEQLIPKLPQGKKKGKKGAPRNRQSRITNVHLKGEVDLTKDYVAPSGSQK